MSIPKSLIELTKKCLASQDKSSNLWKDNYQGVLHEVCHLISIGNVFVVDDKYYPGINKNYYLRYKTNAEKKLFAYLYIKDLSPFISAEWDYFNHLNFFVGEIIEEMNPKESDWDEVKALAFQFLFERKHKIWKDDQEMFEAINSTAFSSDWFVFSHEVAEKNIISLLGKNSTKMREKKILPLIAQINQAIDNLN